MTKLYRAWFRAKKSGNYIASYHIDSVEQFGLQETADPEQAVSIITDRTAPFEVEARLFQAFSRHPNTNGIPLDLSTIIDAFQIVRRYCDVEVQEVPAGTEEGREITYVVGDARVDFDRFGAERQIARDDNRILDMDEPDWANRRFMVLNAGRFVDGQSGAFYPGITVAGPDEAVFWALPDAFMDWAAVANELDAFPCSVQFAETEDGEPYAAIQPHFKPLEDK
ncbi:hypothetical protein [Lacticaseibacillus sharpeae]|uniref:Uncharacterized protein n=1 Tax=Lacticaseibacillus sharpeae JCM 1186 = DSM 20505 TaxID=1291052 RepID=A0A0R1ZIF9_9LACO|nr:hypothetical protein [Lacticaseibacillus sharpeae]KRM54695.1 hypothetical protein FC18_GL002108 [Lacticaseibacillus sharpeae JCM 1186 = DSM 20505]